MRVTPGLRRGDGAAGRPRWFPPVAYLLFPTLVLLRLPLRQDPELAVKTFGWLFSAVAVTGIAYAARAAWHPRLDRPARRPWRPLVAFFVLLLVGGAALSSVFATDPNTAEVSPQLLFALASRVAQVLLVVAAMLAFAAAPLDRRGRAKLMLDVLTVMGGAFIPLWYVLIGPVLAGQHRDAGSALTLYSVTFALCDLGSIVAISAVLLRGPAPAVRRPITIWLVGAVGYLLSDLYFIGLLISDRPYTATVLTDLSLLVPAFVLVSAAVERCRSAGANRAAERAEPVPHTRAPSALPYGALAIGFGVLVVAAFSEPRWHPWRGLIVASLCMTVGVAARQLIALRENFALVRTDPLTGIASRVQLHAALDRAVAASRRSGTPVAVLAIDFNGFKSINDTYGHEAGDALLKAFGRALRDSLRTGDTPARIGGDEFVAVLDGIADADAAVAVAERILAESCAPVVVDGHELVASVSIGIALANPAHDGSTASDLLRHADRAMYAVKREGRRGWHLAAAGGPDGPDGVDGPGGVRGDTSDARLRADIVQAVGSDQLTVVYQPIVALVSGDLVAVEALVRWRHPTRGLLQPAEFMPAAADAGVVHDIDMWVLAQASRQMRVWTDRLPPERGLSLSINLSSQQLAQPALASEVLQILDASGLDPARLVVEINAAEIGPEASSQLAALRERGVRVALDDFGTGYASLRQLSRLPVDILKLDRSFVAALDGRPDQATVMEAIIRLGQILRLDTVAKGVEDAAEATELTLLGCRTAQGYHFARPLSERDMDALIDESSQAWPHLPCPRALAGLAR